MDSIYSPVGGFRVANISQTAKEMEKLKSRWQLKEHNRAGENRSTQFQRVCGF